MMLPAPPVTVSFGYAVVRCDVSIRMLAFAWAGTRNGLSGNCEGRSIPDARTTFPTGASSMAIGGSRSDTNSQLVEGKLCPRELALPIRTAFFQREFGPPNGSTFQAQSNAA